MTILSFIKKVFTNSDVAETKKVSEVVVSKDSTVNSIFVNDKKEEKYIPKEEVIITKNTRESVYKKIEDLCVEYRMSIEDVKKAQLLEGILGCAPEHLASLSDEEINNAIDALKHILTYSSFKLPWKDRDCNDIMSIKKKANERYIYKSTGRTAFSNVFRRHDDLQERLKKSDYLQQDKDINEYSDEELRNAVNNYFSSILASAISSNDLDLIEKSYEKALKIYGDLLVDTEDSRLKEILTSAISNLSISGRETAVKITIASCGDDVKARSSVARGINANYMKITCSEDATGKIMTTTAATNISSIAYMNMSEEDSRNAYQNLNKDATEFFAKNGDLIEYLKQKDPASLSKEERLLLLQARNGYYSQYAGAMTGIPANVNISEENKLSYLAEISSTLQNIGITTDVYQTIADYIVAYPESITAKNISEIVKLLDVAVNGEFSKEFYSILSKTKEFNNNVTNNTYIEKTNKKSVYVEKADSQMAFEKSASTGNKALRSEQKYKINGSFNPYEMQTYTSNPILNNEESPQNRILNENKPVKTKELISAIRAGVESFDKYIESNGSFRTVLEVFNNIKYISEAWVVDKTMRIYNESFSPKQQADTLRYSNNTALSKLLPITCKEALYDLEGETFVNFYATKQVETAIEEAKEKEREVSGESCV